MAEVKQAMIAATQGDCPMDRPLVIFPESQIANHRAKNQGAVYVAQTDLRRDLAEAWQHIENNNRGDASAIAVKLILPKGTTEEVTEWL